MRTQIAVIGSGPGGSITAALLAEHGYQVTLIESGPHMGVDSSQPFSLTEIENKYKHGGITTIFGNPKIAYVEGSCVGGGSEINSGLYHRLPEVISDLWRDKYRVRDLTEAHLKPHYEVIEKELSVSLLPSEAPAASLKLHVGAQRLAWESKEVPRWYKYSGDNGRKQTMSETYIPKFLKNGGRLFPELVAKKFVKDGRYIVLFCEKKSNGQNIELRAETIFVCCGAIGTASLLKRSGIKKNIGSSLNIHPTIKVIARFGSRVNSEDMGVPVHQVTEFSHRYSFGCAISTIPYLKLGLLDYPEHLKEVEKGWEYMASYYAMIVPKGHGSITNIPLFDAPFVHFRLEKDDMQLLSQSLRNLCLLLIEAGAVVIFPSLRDFGKISNKNQIESIPEILPRKNTNLVTLHIFSSCPMGEDTTICGADSYGKIHGHDNIYVNDGSLLCSAPGVNPQGTIMAIARRNVLHFIESFK